MPTTIFLTKESISDISKNVFRPGGYSCDWLVDAKPCKIVLGCWRAYSQHLYKHCQERHGQRKCQIHWCNVPSRSNRFSSVQTLFEHVEKHLEKSPLLCPIRECQSTFTFSTRSRSVTDHFMEVHLPFLGTSVTLPSNLLAPTSLPFQLEIPQPSNIPVNLFLGSVFSGEVRNTQFGRPEEPIGSQAPTASQIPSGSPRKRRMLPAPQAPAARGPKIFEFDNLIPTLDKEKNWSGSLKGFALLREEGPLVEVSRPQPTLTEAFRAIVTPPRSILFDVYAQQYEEKYGPLELDDEDEDKDKNGDSGDPMAVDRTDAQSNALPPAAPSQSASSSSSAL